MHPFQCQNDSSLITLVGKNFVCVSIETYSLNVRLYEMYETTCMKQQQFAATEGRQIALCISMCVLCQPSPTWVPIARNHTNDITIEMSANESDKDQFALGFLTIRHQKRREFPIRLYYF